jgi:hypothetical protein
VFAELREPLSRYLATGGLDLDDFGAEIGEIASCERTGGIGPDLDDADAFKRRRAIGNRPLGSSHLRAERRKNLIGIRGG